MRIITIALSAAAVLCLSATSAEAGSRTEHRENRQEARIAHGVASGELTRPEARRLQRGQQRVDLAQAVARADGVVTRNERQRLENMQDRESARIASEKHDAQHRRY
ncbi:hypothetical protein [Pseudomarimonas salicorniae]|uniref:Uncharacterized protein n=1 Tax=Pseudomarimonas salicorniae TaxID=2933270 RepID=A0ABT0GJP8_9GAMM|nr:hypothetical protein [Lysobacter sp. CAU 1642]MCK7594760.1 hypothetical protein [Lysobacter sp. CAU 1642]